MKRIIILLGIAALIITSCESPPVADFLASEILVEPNQIVYFTNNSHHADYYEWDFGDCVFSTNISPSHHYQYTGVYRVSLTAFKSGKHADVAYMDIEVVNPTELEITVLEYYEEYPVADASILLYPTLTDWDYQTNALSEAFTNNNGVAYFTGLNAQRYYIDVWHEYYNNYLLRDDDVAFIETLPLIPHELNTFIAYVDYVEAKSRNDGRTESKLKIIKIERTLSDKKTQSGLANK